MIFVTHKKIKPTNEKPLNMPEKPTSRYFNASLLEIMIYHAENYLELIPTFKYRIYDAKWIKNENDKPNIM